MKETKLASLQKITEKLNTCLFRKGSRLSKKNKKQVR
jgi:hypothetical protein